MKKKEFYFIIFILFKLAPIQNIFFIIMKLCSFVVYIVRLLQITYLKIAYNFHITFMFSSKIYEVLKNQEIPTINIYVEKSLSVF